MESLARWLSQLREVEERNEAVEFVKSRLLFIGNEEVIHLAHIAFPDLARPLIGRRVARELRRPFWSPLCLRGETYSKLLRSCLFLGLSDGAHMDLFRRANSELSNEQVFGYYDLSGDKADDMLGRLSAELGERYFRLLFVLDDFSGSGLSCMRVETDGKYHGKIHKVLEGLFTEGKPLNRLFDLTNLEVHVILYVATTHALSYLQQAIGEWREQKGVRFSYSVSCAQELPGETCVTENDGMYKISARYFDRSIIDEHYSKGDCSRPYLGFDGCALPLVFSHNTPNNSIPLLWFDGVGTKYRGLFPRVGRHKSAT